MYFLIIFISYQLNIKAQGVFTYFVHLSLEFWSIHSHKKLIMKFFLAFLAIFAAASAQDDCELCKMGVDALGKYLSTEAEIAAVEEGRMIFILKFQN